MSFEPDLRASKMESSEGRGIARSRWLRWWESLPEDLRDALGEDTGYDRVNAEDYEGPRPNTGLWHDVATEAREQSELVGFWVTWHKAGGFQALELSGWNRATIYRKLRRFRIVFDAHPDEYDFPWITLDLTALWLDELGVRSMDEPLPPKRKRG